MVTKCPKLTKADTEANFQKTVIKWLKKQGCFVMKLTPMPGIPDGTSDIEAIYKGRCCWVECKKSEDAPFRPGQKRFLQEQSKFTLSMAVYPENYGEFQDKFLVWKRKVDNA